MVMLIVGDGRKDYDFGRYVERMRYGVWEGRR
jgi:hypothetical protein